MKNFTAFRYATLFITCFLIAGAYTGDLQKEKRWREQVVESLLDGEAVTLNDGQHDFLGIYTEGESRHKTGVIIMHGMGVHPDYPTIINPLRVGLAEKDWNTLSLQMPVLPNEAEIKDYAPLIPEAASRIRAGITYLEQAGLKRVIVIAHSIGATMATHALSKDATGINGLVIIGSGPGATHYLKAIDMPVLDLYGSDDQPVVISNSSSRRAASAHNKHYSQVVAKGADHFFNDQEEELIKLVAGWLDKQAK